MLVDQRLLAHRIIRASKQVDGYDVYEIQMELGRSIVDVTNELWAEASDEDYKLMAHELGVAYRRVQRICDRLGI